MHDIDASASWLVIFLLIAVLGFLAMGTAILIVVLVQRRTKVPPILPKQRLCPGCGRSVAPNAPEGLCPACLLQEGTKTERGTQVDYSNFTPPTNEELAKIFPQLEILQLLGRGGMGAVYKARQKVLDRMVALKILPTQAANDPGFAERFTREAQALARLNHPNIVSVFEYGQSQGLNYFIMEFVDGANLRDIEQAGRLSPAEALKIIPQICEALQFAHDQGVVHRDIKPENILLDKKGRVKIADFGLAKILGREPTVLRLTAAGQVMGTPHYMAPEQIEHPLQVDHRADIYSLGVVFYEMLTGELPLGKFALPSSKVQVDVRLDEVVLRTLEKEPQRRYQHASQVKTDVEGIAQSKAPPATGASNDAGLSASTEKLFRVYPWGIAFCVGGLLWLTIWGYINQLVDRPSPLLIAPVGFFVLEGMALFCGLRNWSTLSGKILSLISGLLLAGIIVAVA